MKPSDDEALTAVHAVVSKKPKRTMSEAQWDEVERAYLETSEPLADLAQRFGISFQRIVAHAKKQKWPDRRISRAGKGEQHGKKNEPVPFLTRLDKAETKEALHTRLHNLLAHHIADAEDRLACIGTGVEQSTAADRERDARTLSSLIRTLEKLIELDDRRVADAKSALAAQELEKIANVEGDMSEAEDMRTELDRRFRRLAELSRKTEMD